MALRQVGFGYLMTFLQHYGLGAVGFTMLITTLTVQWSIIVEGVFLVLSDADSHSFPMSISFLELIDGNFAAATVLISFGALIGKVGPTQVMALAMFEVVAYAANKRFLMIELIGIADIGGTVVIHCFGAYFGLAAAWVLGVPKDDDGNSDSSSISDIFSLIGTVFLWLYALSHLPQLNRPAPLLTLCCHLRNDAAGTGQASLRPCLATARKRPRLCSTPCSLC
eukprot:COSAG02_NODE_1705_length_11236_cov_6.168178_6_plen_224_part_00